MSKNERIRKKYSSEFKLSVIMDMRENQLGYRETVRKYWGTHSRREEDNHKNTVKSWERIFLNEGAEGLMKKRLCSTCKTSETKKVCLPKLDKKTEKDLIAENQRLRMEIDYLKKLRALVLAEERKNGKRR